MSLKTYIKTLDLSNKIVEGLFNYMYCIVDAQIYITSAFHAIKNTVELDKLASSIVTSFIYSMMKLQAELKFDKLILLHDTYPYHKSLIIDDYKGDRNYITQNDIDNTEDENKKKLMQHELNQIYERGKAKNIIKNLGKIGIPSISYPGYEADDLAYLVSKYISTTQNTGVLCSWDSDWMYWCTDNVDWYSKFKGLYQYSTIMTDYKDTIPKDLSLFEYKKYYDSLYGSHNALSVSISDDWYDETFKYSYESMNKGINIFKDKELFKSQFNSLDINKYPDIDIVNQYIEDLEVIGHYPTYEEVSEFFSSNSININIDKYMSFISKRNKLLYCE